MGRLLTTGRIRRDERGAGVVTALMVTLIVFALGATWTSISIHQVESSSFERNREQALHAAEAGLNLALSQLAGDYDWSGTSGVVDLGDETGEYEVEVTPVDPADPQDLDRYIVAKGYAPNATANRRASRQVEQQVRLTPADGFDFALFASPGGITGDNNSTITGDVYSAEDVELAQYAKVFGDVTSVGTVTTTNNSTVGGRVHAGDDVTIQNNSTTVQGDVLAGGNVAVGGNEVIGGVVDGDAQARGTITVTGSVAGTISESNPPPAVPVLTQPSWTWDATNYAPAGQTWTDSSGFSSYWVDNKSAFGGHHRITVSDLASNTISFDDKWTMSGDVTIASDAPIQLSRDVVNGAGADVTLTIISLSNADPAIELTNNLTMPASIKILLYAPNGVIDFSQLKDFHGVVYGEEIQLSQQFTLGFSPPDVPGFGWGATSAVHFDVETLTFQEVPFGS